MSLHPAVALLLTTLAPAPLPAGLAIQAASDLSAEVEQILDRHARAVGAERMAALTAIRSTGRYSDDLIREMPFVYTHVLAGRSRFDGGLLLIVATEHGCFTQGGRRRPRVPQPPAQCERAIRTADMSATPLLRYDRSRLRYLGPDTVDERPVFKFAIDFEFEESAIYYLAAETYLLLRVDEIWRIGEQELLIKRFYEDYRQEGGYMLPHRMRESNPEGRRLFEYDRYEINPTLDPADFEVEPPPAEPPPG